MQSNYKEIASKVVELQHQVMSLRAKLKSKEHIEEENERLRAEVSEMRAKAAEHDRKKARAKDDMKTLQEQVDALLRENKDLKEEIGDSVLQAKAK